MRIICPVCKGEGSYLIPADLHKSAGPRVTCYKCKGTGKIDALEAGLDT